MSSESCLGRVARYLERRGAGRECGSAGAAGAVAGRGALAPQATLQSVVETFGPEHGGLPAHLFGADFDWSRFERACAPSGSIVFWDLETCGLGDTLIFLFGCLRYRSSARIRADREHPGGACEAPLRLELILARHPAAEGRLLRAGGARLERAACWVTFNGRSFDHPRLRKRAFRHSVELPQCPAHLDLLLLTRRRCKGELPNCRLGTVERRLLGLERPANEVPGREVPERYRDFVATGNERWLEPVLEHNRRDLVALAALFLKLTEKVTAADSPPEEAAAVVRHGAALAAREEDAPPPLYHYGVQRVASQVSPGSRSKPHSMKGSAGGSPDRKR